VSLKQGCLTQNFLLLRRPIRLTGLDYKTVDLARTEEAQSGVPKLIVSYLIGSREAECAYEFIQDVAARLANRVQLTTDGHRPYLDAVEEAFGADVDYGMLVKIYSETPDLKGPERKYSPGECCGTKKRKITGNPDRNHVSTSYVEKHNQSMRQHMKRFARLTAAHSKKVENHIHMVSLYTVWYNSCGSIQP